MLDKPSNSYQRSRSYSGTGPLSSRAGHGEERNIYNLLVPGDYCLNIKLLQVLWLNFRRRSLQAKIIDLFGKMKSQTVVTGASNCTVCQCLRYTCSAKHYAVYTAKSKT